MPIAEAPETRARKALMVRLTQLFPTIPVRADKLSKSMGDEYPCIGVSPIRMIPWSKDYQVNRYEILVQFYDKYHAHVERHEAVDPTKIEKYAAEARQGFETNTDPGQSGALAAWFFTIVRTEYLDDPTGNKTRFEMTLTCWGEGQH